MDRAEKSVEHRHNRNNCCQAVLLAFADKLDLSEEQLRKIGAPLGRGLGNMEGPCGALIGAEIVLGETEYRGNPLTPQAKELQEAFVEKTGALLCKDIKGAETGKVLCDCDTCCINAVRCLEEIDF
jgi:C_GCAxxG_C_C family probable redox protein